MRPGLEKAKVNYDYEGDIFSARPLKRCYDSSFQIGNLIFDIDREGRINGLEIVNASKQFNTPKLFLRKLVNGKLFLEVNKHFILLNINLQSDVRNAIRNSSVQIERISPDFILPTKLNLAVA